MKIFFAVIFFLCCPILRAQKNFIAIDTVSAACKFNLDQEYKKKFEGFNKSIAAINYAQRGVTKEIYTEIQESFLEKIKNNLFICDESINPYLDGLMKEVLIQNGIKQDSYRMLLSRSSDVNAHNTGDGTIVVNYGLFLAVDNEDELVFVISHEIGHQRLEHVKKDVEDFAKLSTSAEMMAKTREIRKQKFGKATMANDLLKNITYQKYDARRKKEIQADSLGLALYKKTNRNLKAAISLLEKLDASDKEKDSLLAGDYKKIFEKNGFVVKQKYFEEEQSLFTRYDKDKRINVDSLKSHPDCATRIKLLSNNMDVKFSESQKTSNSFAEIKKNSTYQNLFNLYTGEKYGLSLYEALKLYKNDEYNLTLKNIIYLNLVKIYASRENYTINRYVPSHSNLYNTDSLNRFISFISNIKMTDLNLIITNFKS